MTCARNLQCIRHCRKGKMKPYTLTTYVLTILLSSTFEGVLSQITECRSGWKLFQGYCYALARERLSWSEAQNVCSAYGGTLAEIHSQAEDDFIKSILNNASIINEVDGVWLGGSDIFAEGSWEWVGSKTPFSQYEDWGLNEPNSNSGYGREDCLTMWKDLGWAWNDEACVTNNVLYFVCQTRSGAYEDIIG